MTDDPVHPANTDETPKHWKLYVLKLEDEKYYVGITTKTVEARFREHLKGASYWTGMHKPLEIIGAEDLGVITQSQAEKIENKSTIECMQKYGTENVQGGRFTSRDDVFTIKFRRVMPKLAWEAIRAMLILLGFIVFIGVASFFKK